MPQCSFCQKEVPVAAERCPHCGAWLSQSVAVPKPNPASLADSIRSLLKAGRKIEAIKIFREQTGFGLAEAKAAVERLERGGILDDNKTITNDLDQHILELLAMGKKIAAIKLYREQTGVGLKEAKDAVEAMAAIHGIRSTPSGGRQALALVLLAAIAAFLIGYLIKR
jgi:ribosomal protein L7/L12